MASATGTSQLGDVCSIIQMLDNSCNGSHQQMAEQEDVVICGGICNRSGEVVVIETIKQVLAPQ